MKAEHRHELKTNALADTLGRLLQGLKTGPSRHALFVWGAIGVIVVAILIGYFWWKTDRANRSALWVKVDDAERKLDDAGSADAVETALNDFKKVADEHPGTIQARVLRFERARALFHSGLERLYAEHDKAVDDLKKARDLYRDLANEPAGARDNNPLLAQEAMMNVAKANEALGDLDEALNGYRKLADAFKDSVLGKAAAERAKYLEDENNRKQVKQLYEKLNELSAKRPEDKPVAAPKAEDKPAEAPDKK